MTRALALVILIAGCAQLRAQADEDQVCLYWCEYHYKYLRGTGSTFVAARTGPLSCMCYAPTPTTWTIPQDYLPADGPAAMVP
jgi:hypothetical protein